MRSWLGRGLIYMFLGAICIGHYVDEKETFPMFAGVVVVILGVLFIQVDLIL